MIYDVLYHVGVVLSSMVAGALIYRFGLRSQVRQIISTWIPGIKAPDGVTKVAVGEYTAKGEKDDKGGAEINWAEGT